MAFDQSKAPRIPNAPKEYNEAYFNQLARALDNFFGVFNSNAGQHMDSMRTASLKTPLISTNIPTGSITVPTGTNNNFVLPSHTFIRINDPGGNFGFTGFITEDAVYDSSGVLTAAASDGQQLVIFNPSTHNLTIHDQDTGSLAAARIITCTGVNINHSTGVTSMTYSLPDSRWVVTSVQG